MKTAKFDNNNNYRENHMKKYLALLILALCLVGCGSDSKSGGSIYTNLEVGDSDNISAKRITGTISADQEVDLYKVDLTKTGRNVQIKCTQKNSNEDISGDQQNLTLLIQIYEEVNGELVMVSGEHAVEGSTLPADLKLNLFVNEAKTLYVHVRDLMDNNSSERPYYISAHYEDPPDGNDSLSGTDTVELSINGSSQTDSIGFVGDTDYFKFTATGGVYNASINFTSYLSAGLELDIKLIHADGTIIENRSLANTGTANLIHNLAAGEYAVVVSDYGNDEFSPTSFFEVSISSVSNIEVNTNDSPSSALTVASPINSSIDYYEDQDWYNVAHAGVNDISIMNLSFSSTDTMGFQIYLYGINDVGDYIYGETVPVFENIYMRSLHGELNATIKLDRSITYYVMVKAANGSDVNEGKDFTLSIDTSSVDDDDDETAPVNDTIANPTALTQATPHSGKIAFRGDLDWYSFTVTSVDNQILSVYLNVPPSSDVDYAMDVQTEAGTLIKRIKTPSVTRRGIDLKTGIQVNSGDTFRVKVYDLQSNNNDTEFYTIEWDVATASTPPDKNGETTIYNSEANEAGFDSTDAITLRYLVETGDYETSIFNVNTTALDISDVTDKGDVATSEHTFDWVSGYIDFQGDEDWYSLDLTSPVGITPTPEKWYYTISLVLYSGVDNSPVEYTLELLPDVDGNKKVNSHTGIQAALGDEDPTVETAIDLSLTSEDTTLNYSSTPPTCVWVGTGDPDQWVGPVYFRISDFYHMTLNDGSINPNPDMDWDVAIPYYFRVKIKLVSGHIHPYTDFETYND